MPAVPDSITVVGSSYYQPIADLVDKLLNAASRRPKSKVGHSENGYAAACVVLLIALLESYTTRVRFKRPPEIQGSPSIPDMLIALFPSLPTRDGVHEIFLLRNIVIHNHIWHLDHSDETAAEPVTIFAPKDLGFSVNKNYDTLVDATSRITKHLKLRAVPTWVGLADVRVVFQTVWHTLQHMNRVSYDHTPLAGRRIAFRGKRCDFEQLLKSLEAATSAASYLDPARPTTVNNAGVDQAGRDDAGELGPEGHSKPVG